MRCQTIINYTLDDVEFGYQPTFCVSHLSDRAFANGFRILNPEFNALPDRIESDTEKLHELLNRLDQQDEWTPRTQFPKRVREAMNPNRRRA